MFHDNHTGRGPQRPERPFDRRRRGGPGHDHGGHGPGAHFRGRADRRGSRRQRRGDVRAAVLVLLEEQPRNGYQIIQELAERSRDAWRPSPGSIYPVLQQLEDEGLVEASAVGTGRTYSLTAAGRTLVAEQREALGKPWESADAAFGDSARELLGTARQVALAARQVLMAGSASQVARATATLVEARRALYGMLAEGDGD
ncbi:MAG: PadR family transcriptional regulator [Acidobacteriota bacterium]|nr:PadR family transcriptional regulator [Acidobacteriota bacterium]